MNRVTLYGNVGKDPDIHTFENGNKVAKFSLATSEKYTDKDGNKNTQTEWHNISFFGKQADVIEKYVEKGRSLIIEGKITYRTYEKDGRTMYYTEIIGSSFHFTGRKESAEQINDNAENDPSYIPDNIDNGDLPF